MLETAFSGIGWQGLVGLIYVAEKRGRPCQPVEEVDAVAGKGLVGDRGFEGKGTYGGRDNCDVTLIELEAVEAFAHEAGVQFSAADSRRNFVTVGVPLNHLVDRDFWVGEVKMRGMLLCEPCNHLAKLTTSKVLKGLLHRGGLRAIILNDGTINVGDVIRPD